MSTKNSAVMVAAVLISLYIGFLGSADAANPPTNSDQLVAQHLDSVASSTVRDGFKDRVVQGQVTYRILVGGAGVLEGKAVLVSEGRKFQLMMKLPNNQYRGEQFVFNGDKVKVALSGAQQTRSALGNFVFVQDAVLREGLLGGTLSTAWSLLDQGARQAKLSFEGLKKIDGRDLYALRYHPHKNSDLEINLYFEPETYRHVETIYNYAVSEGLTTGGETASARQVPNRFRLVEKFSDFKTLDGITLPTQYDIQFSQELQNGRTTLSEWELTGLSISNNQGVDPKNFEVQ